MGKYFENFVVPCNCNTEFVDWAFKQSGIFLCILDEKIGVIKLLLTSSATPFVFANLTVIYTG